MILLLLVYGSPVVNPTHPKGYVVLNENYPDEKLAIGNVIFNATAELGLPRLGKLENGIEIDTMYLPVTARVGRRMSTGKVHLAKVSGRPNLHVIRNAHVRKIHFERGGKVATKVTFVLRDVHELSAEVRKEVVLSAGAIDSPKLLLLSGVGPRKHLKELRIPVVRDLAVGANLCDRGACVNPRLLLYDVQNLRVADASIMPDVPRGNTNAPAIMIGERAAVFIKEDWNECTEIVEPK